MELEISDTIIGTQFRIGNLLSERKAFDVNSAAYLEPASVNFQNMLEIMEKSKLIERTSDGKIFMTKKGRKQHLRGFTISNNFSDRKFIRFSRNK